MKLKFVSESATYFNPQLMYTRRRLFQDAKYNVERNLGLSECVANPFDYVYGDNDNDGLRVFANISGFVTVEDVAIKVELLVDITQSLLAIREIKVYLPNSGLRVVHPPYYQRINREVVPYITQLVTNLMSA